MKETTANSGEGPQEHRYHAPIRYLGPNATGLIRAMQLYYETGRAFADGCGSLREIGKRLEVLQIRGDYPEDQPCSVSSVQRACARVEEFFQGHFRLERIPELLQRTGAGMSFAGLTELGWEAWRLIEAFLRSLGVLVETA